MDEGPYVNHSEGYTVSLRAVVFQGRQYMVESECSDDLVKIFRKHLEMGKEIGRLREGQGDISVADESHGQRDEERG